MDIDCSKHKDRKLLNCLTKYTIPEIDSIKINNCGRYFELVRKFLNNSLPYEIYGLVINGDIVEEDKEFDEDSEQMIDSRRTIKGKPDNRFIEDLCEAIAVKVSTNVKVTSMELTSFQFCSIITAADNAETIIVINNRVGYEDYISFPYSNLLNIKKLYLYKNCLDERIPKIEKMLEEITSDQAPIIKMFIQ